MEIDAQKIKKFLSKKSLEYFIFSILLQKIKFIILFVLIGLLIFCVYVWYGSIYAPEWSETKKQEYAKSKDKGVSFNKSNFKEVVSEFQRRKEESEKPIENSNDIFRLKN